MNVASLELCKELEAVSSWDNTHMLWTRGDAWDGDEDSDNFDAPIVVSVDEANWMDAEAGNGLHDGRICSAYDLGYLLRKLPEEIGNKILVMTNGERPHIGYAERDNYGNYTLDEAFYRNASYASELEDAAAKLAIELFKQGVLSKEVI